MKTMDLNACGVAEMTRQEMLETDGGNIFGDAWNWIKQAGEDIAYEIAEGWENGAGGDIVDWINSIDWTFTIGGGWKGPM